MDESISTNCPAVDAPEDTQYHPLILQNTLYSQILAVTNKIESEKKHNFLPNLYNAFQNALKCDECCSTLDSDIIEFACQHKFCGKCSMKITSCSRCTETGYDVGTTYNRDFSFLLNEITKMKENCNAESVIFNLVRFLINPSSMDSSAKLNPCRSKNSVFKTPQVSTSVKKSTSKRILAKSDKSRSTKRQLLSSKETDSPSVAPSQECDSESLFLCLQDKTEKCEKIIHSYLEEQDSILNQANKYEKNLKTYSRKGKRKSTCLELDKQSSNDEITKQKGQGDASNFASPAPKKIKLDPKENSNGANKITAYISSTKRRQKCPEESCENTSDSAMKGTFIGFEQTCADQSYNKFESVQKHFTNICAKLGSTNVVDDDTLSKGKQTSEENISQANRRSSRKYNRTRENEDLEPEKNPQPAKTLSETRGKRKSVKLNKQHENILESDQNEKLTEETLQKENDVAEVDRVSIGQSRQKKPDVEKPALRENLRKRVSLPETTEIPLCDSLKKDVGNDDVNPAKNETEKENLDAIASDCDMDDVVDTRLWERHDRQTRKKQKLFKSLKERKKKNVLLTLLEEKRLQKEKQSQEDSTESEVSSTVANTLVTSGKDESLLPTVSQVNETKDVPAPDEKLSLNVELLSPKRSPKSAAVDVKNCPHNNEYAEQMSTKSSPNSVPSITVTSIDKPLVNALQQSPEKEIANTDERPVVTVPKSPAREVIIESNSVSTPSMERVQFRYPTPVTKPSTESFASPLPTVFEDKFDDGFANSSTPIQMKEENGKSDEKSTPRNDENDETLKLNCTNSPQTSVERKLDTTQGETAECETVTAKDIVKQKCEKLRRSIRNQNEKLFVGLKRNFGVKSPQSLSIEKLKSPSVSKRFSSLGRKDESCPDIDRNDAMNTSTISTESDFNNAPTVPNSSTVKEVACQTTSDLHVALLAQEFPHLFRKLNPLSSVYDTPAQSEIRPNKLISPNIKTPEPSLLDCYSRAKYTTVSSVTTSEKKRGEVEFACRSVLHDTLRTPFSGIGANSSPADISSISLLPSSEKKTPSSVELTSDKRRLSVRLNFQNDEKLYSDSDCVESAILNDEELYSKDIISCTDDDIVAFCAKIKVAAGENSLPASTLSNTTDGKRSELSSPSKEIEFTEVNEENRGTNKVNSNNNSHSDTNVKEISTIDPDYIPDSAIQVQDDVEMFEEGDRYETETKNVVNSKSPETPKSDDEDIDFVAGTPMCSQKEDSEKVGTPNQVAKVSDSISILDDKSHLMFDSNDYLTSKIAGISDHHSVSKTMDENNSSINIVPASFSMSKPCSSRSLNFSNMKTEVEEKVICFFTSGLKEIDFRLTKAFCEKFPVIMQDKLTDDCTHLIVKTDCENRASRTFKYLQAIVNNIFIVSISWIEECLRCGHIVNEENFVPLDSSNESGPLRAYNVAKGLTPSPLSWLRDFCLFFEQPIPQGCTLVQLQEIARKTGAIVVNTLDEMDAYPRHHHIVIISDDDENMEGMAENIKNWLQRYHAVAVEFNWLLEVIGRNRLVPFVDHEFAEIPSDLLRRFNFPNEMLEPEMENAD